ncbi:MAG: glycosyltransferase family 61 protein [Okeania sp. SIO2F4]|nr:glycosyltransferase family 61 protein [Okeania sp. SIO2F4]
MTRESISVAQKASLLAHSQVIVATNCTGLTNLVFCHPGTKVIEIFYLEYVINYYFLLSNIVSIQPSANSFRDRFIFHTTQLIVWVDKSNKLFLYFNLWLENVL